MSIVAAARGRAVRAVAHVLFSTRRWTDAIIRSVAADTHDQTILEIGSGRQDLGAEAYSVRALFDSSNDFVQSDINPEFGHRIVDVTAMTSTDEFDMIICMYVLEHVYDVSAAVAGMHRALRPGGRVVVAVPHVYPYHDEPIDFWRFTEYSLRRLFADFTDVEIRARGMRRFPTGLVVIATR